MDKVNALWPKHSGHLHELFIYESRGGEGPHNSYIVKKSSKYDPSLLFFLLLVCAYRKLGVFTPQQKVTAKNFHFEVQSKKGL